MALGRTGLGLVVAAGLGASTPAHAAWGPAADDAPAPSAPDELVAPKLQTPLQVTYPEAALQIDPPPRGTVQVELTIGVDGIPKELSVTRSVDPILDEDALRLVGALRYTPATYQGEKVEIVTKVSVPYAPPQPEPEPEPEPEPAIEPDTPQPSDAPTTTEEPESDGPVRMSGTLLEAGVRTPIQGATIVAVPAPPDAKVGEVKKQDYTPEGAPAWQVAAYSDENGEFELRGTFAGKVRIVVLAPGYDRLEFVESLPADQQVAVKYYALRLPQNPYRTVVQAEATREEVARRTITVEEINALPGTQGDALKAIQNFPGVARSPFGIGLLAIRGTGPNDSAIYLGEHEIPTLFHFGGLTSVFNSDILERIDFIPGNFDSRYGDAIGGVVDVQPRAGRRDGYHGYIDSDIFDTGVLVEGPIGKGSFALSGRRSYIDLLLPVFIPDDAGLDLTIAPRYYDYQALFDYPLGGGMFTFRAFGSDDRTKLVASDPNEVEEDEADQFETTSFFHRVDLAYRRREGPWSFLFTPSYRLEFAQFGIGNFFNFDLQTHNVSMRAEVERKLGKRHSFRVGTEYQGLWFAVDVRAPPLPGPGGPGGSTGTDISASVRDAGALPALYSTVTLGVTDKLTLYPGVRLGFYTLVDRASFFDPRLNAKWEVADRTTLKAGVGIYSQAPQPVEISAQFGNPRLGLQRGLQSSVGVSQAFDYGFSIDGTVFFNNVFDQPANSAELARRPDGSIGPELYANTQRGRVYGAEILARKELTGNVFGWVAYTLSRSERRPTPDQDWVLFGFDQTHILTLIGVYKLPKGWQVGARMRVVSGLPNTPVIASVYDASSGDYIPVNGELNSDRLPVFHQLDLRVDKQWTWKLASLTLYLDVQNVYNNQNTEFIQYSYDFSQQAIVAGLPIIPSIGTKVAF